MRGINSKLSSGVFVACFAASLLCVQTSARATESEEELDDIAAQIDMEEFNVDEFDEDESAPLDLTPVLSGVLQASFRYTWHNAARLRDGTQLYDKNEFQIEHTHIKIAGHVLPGLAYEILPCLTYMNSFSVYTAFVEYAFNNYFIVTFGRFLLPFGQFNLRSLPGVYTTISPPLLYLSHEEHPVHYGNATPVRFLFTPRDDAGMQVGGSLWFLDDFQLSYTASFTNGLRAESHTMARFWDDNNPGKQGLGRLALVYNGLGVSAGIAGTFLYNRWARTEEGRSLEQIAWEADAFVTVNFGEGRKFSIRGEYVSMIREIIPTETLIAGDEGVSGAYVVADVMFTEQAGLFFQGDTLSNRRPRATYSEDFYDQRTTVHRLLGGVVYMPGGTVILRLEFSHWFEPVGLPDANRVSLQSILTF